MRGEGRAASRVPCTRWCVIYADNRPVLKWHDASTLSVQINTSISLNSPPSTVVLDQPSQSFEQRGVDLTEIGVKFEIAVVQIGQAGMFTHQSCPHSRSGKKHGSGSAVIGSFAGVFRNSPSEFAERHHQRSFAMAMMRDIFKKGAHRAAELLQ